MTPKQRTIPDDVLDMLRQGTCEGNRYTMPQLDRPDYERTKKVLDAAGLKWNRKAKAHLAASGNAAEIIEILVVTGEYVLPADFGAFDTPHHLASQLVEAAHVSPGMTVLEPSAGKGHLVQALLDAGARITAVELQPDRFPQALRETPLVTLTVGDFMAFDGEPRPLFDRVVMNPPFAAKADVRHIMHALPWLKPDGRLVAIMSAGVKFRQDREVAAFRDLVAERGGEINDLPEESFRAAGTSVNTVMVSIPAA